MSEFDYDLLVIGTGPAASTVARKVRDKGKSVAIVEQREFGGTCALRGCNPKKVYANSGALIAYARAGSGKLVGECDCQLDWQKLVEFKREFTDSIPEKSRQSFEDDGIDTFQAAARFTGRNEVRVGERTISALKFMIATGAQPVTLGIPGEEHVVRSDQFMELESMPDRVVFIGGGYVSMEFAHVVVRYDRAVAVLERSDRILGPFDPDLVQRLTEWSGEIGMNVQCQADVKQIERNDDHFVVSYDHNDEQQTIQCDLVVHGAGRTPNLETLNLVAADVGFNSHGIEVDEYLRSTSNPAIFAAGDCADTGQPKLTPVANEQARAVAINLTAKDKSDYQKPDYGAVPSVAFTTPAIAAVGMSESEARDSEHDIEVRQDDMSSWGSVRKTGLECAAYKVLVDKESEQVLGAHLLGPGVEETINLFALAMKFGLTASDIKSVLIAFPTFSSDVRNMI